LAACRTSLPVAILAEIESGAAKLGHTAESIVTYVADFFGAVVAFLEKQREWNGSEYSQKLWITPAVRQRPGWDRVAAAWENLSLHLVTLAEGLARLGTGFANLEEYDIPDWDELTARIMAVQRRLAEVRAQTGALVANPSEQMIYWLELDWRGLASVHVAPLDVGPLVERYLFKTKTSIVLASATLRTGKSFHYVKERLHAWECEELAVGSPFDYASSTLLYLTSDIPEPDQPGYQPALERALVEVCRATRGRALVLFTSHSQLQTTARAITGPLERAGILVFEQGESGSRRQLLEGFRLSERAVLLGTRSFWEGVDVPGQALSSLIITRLPFTVPSDPIFAARSQTFKEPFLQYAVPEAILRFRQGFGRLIRSRSDRGVVTVLDRRILTKTYGRHFLESLPACTVRRGPAAALPALAARWIDGVAPGTEKGISASLPKL
jgi:DNA polymerase-3 subunit epsilon/ATP-dependent DNA helicase DinG